MEIDFAVEAKSVVTYYKKKFQPVRLEFYQEIL